MFVGFCCVSSSVHLLDARLIVIATMSLLYQSLARPFSGSIAMGDLDQSIEKNIDSLYRGVLVEVFGTLEKPWPAKCI